MKAFSSISSLLRQHLRRSADPLAGPDRQKQLRTIWRSCAGKVAMHSYPFLFESGRVLIYTESSIWATEIRHRRQELEAALGEMEINRLDVHVGPSLPDPRPVSRELRTISEQSRMMIDSAAKNVRHQSLRLAMERLAKKTNQNSG